MEAVFLGLLGDGADGLDANAAHVPQSSHSLKRSDDGEPPGPGWWHAVHFCRPGLGVLPSSPA
jgi:hypothetical protein